MKGMSVRFIVSLAHVFVDSKAPWFTITDRLPKRNEFD
jgi:hypothetical protein